MPTLSDLGLSEYQARVYRALLRTGPTTAKALSRASGVPMGRIYDVLADLEATGLARSQQAGRPKKYAPVDPETGLHRLLEDRRREAAAEVARYEEAVEALADDLEAGEAADGQFYTVAIGPDDAFELLLERVAAAAERVDMVVGEVSSQFDLEDVGARIAEELASAVDRGVSVSVLVSPEMVEASPPPVLRRYAELLGREGFAARTTTGLEGNVTLADGLEVCVGVANPLAPEEAMALIALRDAAFARNLAGEFEPRWEAASPVEL